MLIWKKYSEFRNAYYLFYFDFIKEKWTKQALVSFARKVPFRLFQWCFSQVEGQAETRPVISSVPAGVAYSTTYQLMVCLVVLEMEPPFPSWP